MSLRREQVATGTDTTFASSVTATFTNTTQAGSIILVAWEGDTGTANAANTPTDTAGNTYIRVVSKSVAATFDLEIWYALNKTSTASNIVTVTDSIGGANGCLIIEEWTGADAVTIVDTSSSNSGSGTTITAGAISTAQPNELIWSAAADAVGGTDLSAAGSNTNLTQVSTTFTNLGIASRVVAATGTYNDGFTSIVSVSWACAQVAIRRKPEGTTTSTSSTSVSSTSTSISSTSSSTSSTSSSTSSTSTSLSTSSTSMSTSSTSSSISSTSSSISSTSISSTSSSTSVSSTSSSISSTSTSSTSTSSTSSSTSISSTSTSFSSTSSSISSTSQSVSSTSSSSTSSSTSTSTTTVPPHYTTYSYQDLASTIRFNAQSVIAAATTTSPATWSHTCSGTNRALIVALESSKTSNPATAVTYGGSSMTHDVGSSTSDGINAVALDVWYLLNPPLGTNTVSVTWTTGASVNLVGGAISLVNVGAFDTSTSATNTVGPQPSLNITPTTANSYVVGFVGLNDNPILSAGQNQIGRFQFNESATPFNSIASCTQDVLYPSSVKVNFANAASTDTWMMGAIAFKAATVPGSNADLTNTFNANQYGNASTDDGDYFIQYGSEYMVQEYKKKWTNNTDTPSFTYKGRSTESTSTSPILVQIYNQNSSAWETLATVNKIPADTDFTVTVSQSTSISNYYDSNNIASFRVYQQVI